MKLYNYSVTTNDIRRITNQRSYYASHPCNLDAKLKKFLFDEN